MPPFLSMWLANIIFLILAILLIIGSYKREAAFGYANFDVEN